MAFSTRRGRPPRPTTHGHDLGTPELCFKRAHGLTDEPIDRLLHRGLISQHQHWCGLHLRWLYTLRYGAPSLTTHYTDSHYCNTAGEDDPTWRTLREREYMEAAALLKSSNRYEPVMRLCIFNEVPAFLNPRLQAQSLTRPDLSRQLGQRHQLLLEGLSMLASHWRPHSTSTKQNNDIP
jgi:hypothetical protein